MFVSYGYHTGLFMFVVTWTVYSSSFLLSQSLSLRSDGLRSCGCVKEGGVYFQEMFWELDALTTGSLICVREFQVGHMWQQPAVAFRWCSAAIAQGPGSHLTQLSLCRIVWSGFISVCIWWVSGPLDMRWNYPSAPTRQLPAFASLSACSFPSTSQWEGTHCITKLLLWVQESRKFVDSCWHLSRRLLWFLPFG